MKKILAFSLALVMGAAVLGGCSNSGETDESLQKVLDKKQLVLGLDDSFPPMGFRNDDNEIVGFDIDTAKEVTKRMGVELKIQPISWESNQIELSNGNVDCLWNGMSVSPARSKAMNLSEAYMKNSMVLVVMNDSAFTSQADLKDKKIGVQSGSTASDILDESKFKETIDEVISYKDNITAFLDLEIGGLDAVFLDLVVADYVISEQKKDYKVLSDGLSEEEYAIGFRKNDSKLRDEVQKILGEMKADGTLAEISTKWFGKDVTIVK